MGYSILNLDDDATWNYIQRGSSDSLDVLAHTACYRVSALEQMGKREIHRQTAMCVMVAEM